MVNGLIGRSRDNSQDSACDDGRGHSAAAAGTGTETSKDSIFKQVYLEDDRRGQSHEDKLDNGLNASLDMEVFQRVQKQQQKRMEK